MFEIAASMSLGPAIVGRRFPCAAGVIAAQLIAGVHLLKIVTRQPSPSVSGVIDTASSRSCAEVRKAGQQTLSSKAGPNPANCGLASSCQSEAPDRDFSSFSERFLKHQAAKLGASEAFRTGSPKPFRMILPSVPMTSIAIPSLSLSVKET